MNLTPGRYFSETVVCEQQQPQHPSRDDRQKQATVCQPTSVSPVGAFFQDSMDRLPIQAQVDRCFCPVCTFTYDERFTGCTQPSYAPAKYSPHKTTCPSVVSAPAYAHAGRKGFRALANQQTRNSLQVALANQSNTRAYTDVAEPPRLRGGGSCLEIETLDP